MSPDNSLLVASRRFVIAITILTLVSAASARPQEKILYSFQGGTDGVNPEGNMVFDMAGDLYGTASNGGSHSFGAVVQLTPPEQVGEVWTESVIYNFKGLEYHDGNSPESLIWDQAGNLYGVTYLGGRGSCEVKGEVVGCGTVYELSPPKKKGGLWTETVLYRLLGSNDGRVPSGKLVFDSAGNLYGAALGGGDPACLGGCGTIFELSPPTKQGGRWTEKVLYSFKGGTDSQSPNGGLIFDKTGAIYGATSGDNPCGLLVKDCGVIFKLNPPTSKYGRWEKKLLHRFRGPDGEFPLGGGLIFNPTETVLYGTTTAGGLNLCNYGCGVVYSLTLGSKGRWAYTTIHRFASGGGLGGPYASLILDESGNLYGTTAGGGVDGQGSVFKLAPSGGRDGLMTRSGIDNPGRSESAATGHGWIFSVLHSFAGIPDGAFPSNGSSLTLDSLGNLYGVTADGGTDPQHQCPGGCGTVYEVTH
jgi:uncharacterized repeat protein (TIGR03803 family)